MRQLENAVFRAVVLADGAELTVAEFPQIAAHVTGFDTAVPAAPAPAPKPGAFKGPALLGAEDIIPQTMEIRVERRTTARSASPWSPRPATSARSTRSRPT